MSFCSLSSCSLRVRPPGVLEGLLLVFRGLKLWGCGCCGDGFLGFMFIRVGKLDGVGV